LKNILPIFLFIIATTTALGQDTLEDLLKKYNTRSVPYISVQGLRALQINDTVTLVDAREQHEYNISHINNAIYAGYNTFNVDSISNKISDKNTSIVVYCSLGIRSEDVAEALKKEGYTNVRNLYGGIFEWNNNAYPIVNSKNQKTDSIHVFSREWSQWSTKGIPIYANER
jgi:rhodanese-related sulfurtransferase